MEKMGFDPTTGQPGGHPKMKLKPPPSLFHDDGTNYIQPQVTLRLLCIDFTSVSLKEVNA